VFNLKTLALTAALAVSGQFAAAGSWTLDSENSKLAFGSVKKNTVGEVHSFEEISGTVSDAGVVKIEVDLASVQTWIDIRNERMIEHVFKNAPKAEIMAQIDMAKMGAMDIGAMDLVDLTGKLFLGGLEMELEAELFVARVSESKVLVSINEMLMLSTADLGIDAGIDTLMGLAKLPGITRVTPVTMRLVFDAGS